MQKTFLWLLLVVNVISLHGTSVDRYGQVENETWPGKITNDNQLRKDAQEESHILETNANPISSQHDSYGGFIDGKNYGATGWFRLQEIQGKWWFITPEGNRFFMQGVDGVSWRESGYSTPLKNPDGSARLELSELPDRNEYPEAYIGTKVSFLGANLKRKYGPDFNIKWKEIACNRLSSWGFNSTTKWGWGENIGLPYIQDYSFFSIPRGFGRYLDMYDPAFPGQAEAAIKQFCQKWHNDRRIIAYCVENENGWNEETISALLRKTKKCPAKEAFFDFLQQRRGNQWDAVALLFEHPGKSREALLGTPLDRDRIPQDEIREFIRLSSIKYHKLLRELYHKYDPNHLFMGAAHCNVQSPVWYDAATPYVDFLGFNQSWLENDMERYEVIRTRNKPFMICEFVFVQEGRGYKGYSSSTTVHSEELRGVGYRLYTEELAAMSHCVGFGFFLYWDQPVSRRTLPDGEAFSFGLVNQQDQPYYEMLKEVKKANSELFAIHDGTVKPFTMENPRSILGSLKAEALFSQFMTGSVSKYCVLDPSKADWFHGNSTRIKLNECLPGPGVYEIGILSSNGGKRIDSFEITAYLWNPYHDITECLVIEESANQEYYTPIKIKARKGRSGINFTEYYITNTAPLRRNTMYLRISQKVPIVKESWRIQYCAVKLETSL